MFRKSLIACAAAALSAVAILPGAADAAWEPKKPIKIYVGFAAGGGTDIPARHLASVAQEYIPVPLVVINKTGAAGTIAAEFVARSEPDGYSLLVAGGSESTSVGNHQKLNYDPREDFTGIVQITRQRNLFGVSGESKWKTIQEFVEDAKANPGKYTYGSGGPGSIYHSAMIVFCKKAGVDMKHVPFRGGNLGLAAVLGGHIQVMPFSPDEGKALIESEQIRPLATWSDERAPAAPDAPTMKEVGYDIYLENMKGIVAPAGLPDEIYTYLHDNFKKAMETEQFKQLAEKSGMDLHYRDGPAFAKAIADMYNVIGESVRN
jgi:tripartite-type tricarboxylate transporter receptor subunit TctC